MTAVVVEVGPGTVRGPNGAEAEWVSAALECIDDDIALIDECPVAVADVWGEVLGAAVGGSVDDLVLVCPTWWTSSRIELVCSAARRVATNVVEVRRAEVLSDGCAPVVEITDEFVVVSWPGVDGTAVMDPDDPAAVATEIGVARTAVVDAPFGIDGADRLAVAIAERLRAHGVSVSIAGRDLVRRAAAALRAREGADDVDEGPPIRRDRRGIAVFAGAALCVAGLGAGFAVPGPSAVGVPVTVLVEGRVGVTVPVQWAVQRVTTGPGSARVQVVSPTDADIAVHITQSSIPSHLTLTTVADMLRMALAQEPDGVFVEFNAADSQMGKPAVTYRENRAERQVAWTVLIDGDVRIAIGCQSGPGREQLVREVCDQAIRSAHAVF